MSRQRKDLTGQKFNHLLVVKRGDDYIPPSKKPQPTWWCLCDCQLNLPKEERRLKKINQNFLVSGRAKSCGCNNFRKHSNFIDLTGHKFGKFLVIKQVDKPSDNSVTGAYWLCQCECGNTRIYRSADINRKKSLSCGECSRNTFDVTGVYGIGYTTNNQEFYFDLEDFQKICKYTWCLNTNGYVVAWDKNAQIFIYMHRLVTGLTSNDKYDVDHKNHKAYDNRKENLRVCSHRENLRNISISKNNTSGVTGVVWVENVQMWHAQIMVNYQNISLIYTPDFDEAVKARKKAENDYFGNYSYDNSMKGKK